MTGLETLIAWGGLTWLIATITEPEPMEHPAHYYSCNKVQKNKKKSFSKPGTTPGCSQIIFMPGDDFS